jgi:hypothetical protein
VSRDAARMTALGRLFLSGVMGKISQGSRDWGRRILEKAAPEIAGLLPEISRGGAR